MDPSRLCMATEWLAGGAPRTLIAGLCYLTRPRLIVCRDVQGQISSNVCKDFQFSTWGSWVLTSTTTYQLAHTLGSKYALKRCWLIYLGFCLVNVHFPFLLIKQARQLISPNYGLRVRRDERIIESCHALVACFNFHPINARESKLSWTFSWNFANGLHSVFLLSPSSDLPASPELLGPIRSGAWGLHARGFPRFWEPFGFPKSLSSHSDPDPARPGQNSTSSPMRSSPFSNSVDFSVRVVSFDPSLNLP